MCAHAASRFTASTAFFFGNVNWCGIVHTTGCLNMRGTGAATKSTLASRSPVKFHEPAIQRPSLPAMNASRQLAFAGGAILCRFWIDALPIGHLDRGGLSEAGLLEIGRVDVG